MCGRFEFRLSDTPLGTQLKHRAEKNNLVFKQGEIFPDDDVLCVVPFHDKIDLKVKRWGIRSVSFQINARVESLNRSYYARMIDKRCCIVCNGFYEWNGDKEKFYITTDEEFFYLAGIYNDKDELLIITKEAGNDFNKIHSRIPIMMNRNEMLEYLKGDNRKISDKKLNITRTGEDIPLF